MGLPSLALVVGLASALNVSNGPAILNVGLPSTGTTSFTRVARRLGLRTAHDLDAYTACKNEQCMDSLRRLLVPAALDLADPSSPLGRAVRAYDALSDIPMMHPRVIAQCASTLVACVATNRSLETWATSLLASPFKGGNVLRVAYGMRLFGRVFKRPSYADWARTWHSHQTLLKKHAVPVIDLDSSDAAKARAFCAAAGPRAPDCATRLGGAWPRAHATDRSRLERARADMSVR